MYLQSLAVERRHEVVHMEKRTKKDIGKKLDFGKGGNFFPIIKENKLR